MDLMGSQTLGNLMRAFAGESQARNRYTFYAAEAKASGMILAEAIFLETADNERAHAKIFFDFMRNNCGGNLPLNVVIEAGYPVDMGDLATNLRAARHDENSEFSDIYPAFAEKAMEEGFRPIAQAFRNIAAIEQSHRDRFDQLLKMVEQDTLFQSQTPIVYRCRNCGHLHTGTSAPAYCPVCNHPIGYFEKYSSQL